MTHAYVDLDLYPSGTVSKVQHWARPFKIYLNGRWVSSVGCQGTRITGVREERIIAGNDRHAYAGICEATIGFAFLDTLLPDATRLVAR